MKKTLSLLLAAAALLACQKNPDAGNPYSSTLCKYQHDVLAPDQYVIEKLGSIAENAYPIKFQMLDDLVGYTVLGRNTGGYVEVHKTSDGGQTWTDLNLNFNQLPRGMSFRDENTGIITLHDVTGCPGGCLNKCVVLRTEDGGSSWQEHEVTNLKGILLHPTYDANGYLYASLLHDQQNCLVRSLDDGITWDTLYYSSDLNFMSSRFSFSEFGNKIYASGKDGNLLVIDSAGQLINTIQTNANFIYDLAFLDQDNMVLIHSLGVEKTSDGGLTWNKISGSNAQLIGFNSPDQGLMIFTRDYCPGDVYQSNDHIGATADGGLNWSFPDQTTTNLNPQFINAQVLTDGSWLFMIDRTLMRIGEE